MAVKITINNARMREIENAYKKALFMTADALKTDVVQSQVMPFDVGTMQNSSTYVATSQNGLTTSLITRTPYAQRLYYHPEYNFQTVNNPNAQGQWMEDYISGSKKHFCEEKFKEFLRRELP